ncbi:MAG: hypothetical protein WCB95_05285 [Aeromicrobium sp.]
MSTPRVAAVSRDALHPFSKIPAESITLVAGMGVLGDAHAGTLVQHRSGVRRDPTRPAHGGAPPRRRLDRRPEGRGDGGGGAWW